MRLLAPLVEELKRGLSSDAEILLKGDEGYQKGIARWSTAAEKEAVGFFLSLSFAWIVLVGLYLGPDVGVKGVYMTSGAVQGVAPIDDGLEIVLFKSVMCMSYWVFAI